MAEITYAAEATAVLAAFPEDADTPTEGWSYGFRSIIDTAQYPNAQDKEGASGMSLEAAWKDIAHWPQLASSGDDFSSEGRPDVIVGYIEIIAELPWQKESADDLDLEKAREILDLKGGDKLEV